MSGGLPFATQGKPFEAQGKQMGPAPVVSARRGEFQTGTTILSAGYPSKDQGELSAARARHTRRTGNAYQHLKSKTRAS
jgi:hypothetical protein